MARTYKRDKNGRFSSGGGGGGKVGKSEKNAGARAEYKSASRQERVAAGMHSRSTDKVASGKRLAQARNEKLKTELSMSGKKKELSALNRAEKRSQKIENQMAAKKAVSKAHERAGKTLKGRLAGVKRALTGGKKRK
jgi:hypothetical protein